MLDLKSICENSQAGLSSVGDPTIIKSLAKFEDTVNDAYQGRLFFELIQNARDAAYKAGINSKIIVCIQEDMVYFGNTGAPFNEKGIIAMTRLGLSFDKQDNKTIGHKGIGFKAIQEFSSTPKIITNFGSIIFNKKILHDILKNKFPHDVFKEKEVPLFYYPHYEDVKIKDLGIDALSECETVIGFELNKNKTITDLTEKFNEILNEELILLGNIESIHFQSDVFSKTTTFKYKENEVTVNDKETFEIVQFPEPVLISNELYEQLQEQEQELFASDKEVDLKIVFRTHNRIPVVENESALYLFYPLEVKSGFSYKIHSYFSCNPQRTDITESQLNDYIFEKIIALQIDYVLPYLKAKGITTGLQQFAYCQETCKKLAKLHGNYIAKIREEKFVWIEQEKDYFSPDEIMLCSKEAYAFIKYHSINNKKLLVVEEPVKSWLKQHFKTDELNNSLLREHIEVIAETEKNNPLFFQKLYAYASNHNLILNDKKVLLGENGELYSNSDKVFLQGDRRRLNILQSIQDKITMLNPAIRLENYSPEKLRLLGLKAFSQEEIIDRALELFADDEVNKSDILIFLMSLNIEAENIRNNIRKKILVPVGGEEMRWISPLYNPIYLESEALRKLYPEGNFFNIDAISYTDQEKLKAFVMRYNVWSIPAVYFIEKNNISSAQSKQHIRYLNASSGFNAYSYTIYQDRKLDFPSHADVFFYESIIKNWQTYIALIGNKDLLPFSVRSDSATYSRSINPTIKTTSFGQQLLENKWIRINENDTFWLPSEVSGINRASYLTERNIKANGFNWLVLNFAENRSFFSELEIAHIDSTKNQDMVTVLKQVYMMYADADINEITDFKKFYHTILKYLYATYELNKDTQQNLVNLLKQVPFFCVFYKDGTESFSWQLPAKILHIDDNRLFQSLDNSVKEQLGFFFTKSDKNEIGKIFNRVAPKLSSRIKDSIHYSEDVLSEKMLCTEINNLIYIILLIEHKIEEHIKIEHLQQLQQIKLKIVNSIAQKTTISSPENTQIPLPDVPLLFYFDTNENVLYVSKENEALNKNKKLLGEMVNDIFAQLLQRDTLDLRLHIRDLMMTNQSDAFQETKKEINFDQSRYEDLKELLDENQLNEEQSFWNAIVQCKQTDNDTSSPFEKFGAIDWHKLSSILEVESDPLLQWHQSFNYLQYRSAQNLPIVWDIVQILQLDYQVLNKLLSDKLNFETVYQEQYAQCKNKYSDTIKYTVYEELKSTDNIFAQRKFKTLLTAIEHVHLADFDVPELFFNVADALLNDVNKVIENFGCTAVYHLSQHNNEAWRKLSKDVPLKVRSFKSRLSRKETDTRYVEEFIMKSEHYSLLYFDRMKELVDAYVNQYPLEEEHTENEHSTTSDYIPVEDDDKDITIAALQQMQVNGSGLDDLYGQMTPKTRSSGGGYHNPVFVNNEHAERTGKEGEYLLFEKLMKKYGNVKWVSEYAKTFGHVPDKYAMGYDMYYIDENDTTHYVEVKTSTGEQPEFHITINEIRTAMAYGDHYHVIWITNVFDKDKREYTDLGNIFINFKEDENFFINKRFKPQLTAFKIAFNPVRPDDNVYITTAATHETA
ncbi:MAG: DUF3883 domain-containing protein [Sphingobacterium sp.]|jgi:hypothetical protein|uniref:DUF3883 domain-containing protein n=1 Tax=Sphingobacterium sp. TaxID=341027 RepID=UPI00283CECF2|nr:DUF3883 domain-containing protein [Sphingobacterium sp.]MDR3006840.1 DUF3883 domain-containing protein [Sphingobacterium sp.]